MKTMRARFPWLDIPLDIQGEIETRMPQFLLQEAAGERGMKFMSCTACGNLGFHEPVAKNRTRGVCPFCMAVEVVDHARLQTDAGELKNLRRSADVMIFRAVDGILWAMDARAYRIVMRDSLTPEFSTFIEFDVHSVYRFEPEEENPAEQWKWGPVWDKGKRNWRGDGIYKKTPVEPTNSMTFYGGDYCPYAIFGLEEALEKEVTRHCRSFPTDVTYLGQVLNVDIDLGEGA